jgi:pyridoxamine 5'-phosphate oxidase family protein
VGKNQKAVKEQRMFSEKEVEYIKSQQLARIATVSTAHQPDVAPVTFEFDGTHFYIGGLSQHSTLKYKNVMAGNTNVALVMDDMESIDPPAPRGIKVHGTAEVEERTGRLGPGSYLKVTPHRYWSWGIEEPVFQNGRIVMKRQKA